MIWAKTYERDSLHTENINGLMQKANGDLIFYGRSTGFSNALNGNSGESLFSTDSLGHVKWFKVTRRYTCPEQVGHFLTSGKLTSNGNIVRGGYIGQFNPQPGCYDTTESIAWIVMTDSMGRKNTNDTATYPLTETIVPIDTGSVDTGLSVRLIPDNEKPYLNLYPNPAKDIVNIKVFNFDGNIAGLTLWFYDYTGRQVLQQPLKTKESNIDISGLPKGLYLIKLAYKDIDIGSTKFVKQ